MASQNLNVGTSANSNDGDTLRAAFVKLKQMFAEVYGQTYSEQGDLSGTDFKINESKLQLTASAVAGDDGKVLTYDHATGGFSWEDAFTGTIGDITGIVAGLGLTGSSLDENEATLNVGAGTGITVADDTVSLATSVQSEISANTLKTGITATQAGHITANNSKVSDQTVTLTDGGNVTITGTYPDFTLSSPDVTGAVTSVNGAVGVVVLDTADVAEDTNLYYTEARVSANTDVAANTAKIGITSGQASEIAANTLKVGITTAQAGEITDNNAKVSNVTHTGDVTDASGVLTLVADKVITSTILNSNVTYAKIQDVSATDRILGRDSAGAGIVEEITPANLRAMINVANGANAYVHPNHSGDVTSTGDGATVIANNAVTTLKIADVNVTTAKIANDAVTHDKLSARFTAEVAISDLTGAAAYDCSAGSSFKLSGDLTGGAYTINLSNYKKGQVITIYPLKGESATLAAGTGTGVFNKLSEMDYDNTVTNILQIECVDDQAANPVFFYSVASFVNDATI